MLKQVELLLANGSKTLSWVDESIAKQGTKLTFDTGPRTQTAGTIIRILDRHFFCGNHGEITRPEGRMELNPGEFFCSACLAEMMKAFGKMNSSHRHGGELLVILD
jgi:hypothetical protein